MTPASASGSLLRALGDKSSELAANRRILERHEDLAEALLDAGRFEDAVCAAAAGAVAATVRHPRLVASERLETLLSRVAARALTPLAPRSRPKSPRRVLHVATETYEVGGHTRVLWRWIARDASRSHSLVTTAQRGPMIEGLRTAVLGSGGDVVALDPDAPFLERAQKLRDLATEFDMVVLHIHHHDVVPLLAFSEGSERPAVVLFNHADHMFWLGTSVVDVLYSCRSCPATELRGIPAERCIVGPVPVRGPDEQARRYTDDERMELRALMRHKLGWPQDALLLLTVGHAHKYTGPPGTTLLDAVRPVLEEAPEARLLMVGPTAVQDAHRAWASHSNQARCVGPISMLGPVFAAADAYLDSHPFCGTGACSEASMHGLPVMAYATNQLEAGILKSDASYGVNLAVSQSEYQQTLARIIVDPDARRELAGLSQAAVLAADSRFEATVELAYRRAIELGPVTAVERTSSSEDPIELHTLVAEVQRTIAEHRPGLDADRLIAGLELAARSRFFEGLFETFRRTGVSVRASGGFGTAFAAPPADANALGLVIDDFRRLSLIGAADRYLIAMEPAEAHAAVPMIEAALAAGSDVDVDLLVTDEPRSVRPPLSLEVVAGGDSRDEVEEPKLVSGGGVTRAVPRPLAEAA